MSPRDCLCRRLNDADVVDVDTSEGTADVVLAEARLPWQHDVVSVYQETPAGRLYVLLPRAERTRIADEIGLAVYERRAA